MAHSRALLARILLALVAFAAIPFQVHSHAILTSPPARAGSNGADNKGIKIPSPEDARFFGTCGNAATQPGPPSATFTAGRPQIVKWEITIDHLSDPGVTLALRCAGQQTFTNLVRGVKAQDRQVQIVVPPTTKAGNCELQWIWSSKEDGGSYVACADIRVVEAPPAAAASSSVVNGGTPTPVAAAAPAPVTTAAAKTSDAGDRDHVTQWLRAGLAGLFVAAVVVSIAGR